MCLRLTQVLIHTCYYIYYYIIAAASSDDHNASVLVSLASLTPHLSLLFNCPSSSSSPVNANVNTVGATMQDRRNDAEYACVQLLRWAVERGLLLCIEDVHNCDTSSPAYTQKPCEYYSNRDYSCNCQACFSSS